MVKICSLVQLKSERMTFQEMLLHFTIEPASQPSIQPASHHQSHRSTPGLLYPMLCYPFCPAPANWTQKTAKWPQIQTSHGYTNQTDVRASIGLSTPSLGFLRYNQPRTSDASLSLSQNRRIM